MKPVAFQFELYSNYDKYTLVNGTSYICKDGARMLGHTFLRDKATLTISSVRLVGSKKIIFDSSSGGVYANSLILGSSATDLAQQVFVKLGLSEIGRHVLWVKLS